MSKQATIKDAHENMAKAAMAKRKIRTIQEYVAYLIEEDYRRI